MTVTATNELVTIAQKASLPAEREQHLLNAFSPYWDQIQTVKEDSKSIVVTSETQTLEMALARSCRLKLKDIRVSLDKTRKELKEDALATGKAIDGMANVLKFLIEPEEKRLEDQEKFAERQQALRRAELALHRADELRAVGVDPAQFDLVNMTEVFYESLLENSKIANEFRKQQAAKAKEEAEAAELARRAELEKFKAENELLRQQQLKERQAREALEAEARSAAKAAAAEKAAQERAERKAAKAPDARKIETLADKILLLLLESPAIADKDAAKKVNDAVLILTEGLRHLAQSL